MTRTHLLGVDIGTQGTKTVLFSERGQVLAAAFRKSKLRRAMQGVVEEDPEYQFRTICQCIRACLAGAGTDPRQIAAIGIDGQMAGILGIGNDGRHVTPYDSWLDTRCSPYISLMRERAGEEIIRKTGGPVSFNHGPKILWWKHEQPDIFERISSFVQPSGYAAMRLCGIEASGAFIDKTYLHFSGFADNAKGCWDEGLCGKFAVPTSKLPRIVNSHDVVGKLTTAAARRCGLEAGTPVVAGCGDTAASFLACGATREGICVDVAGTASVFAATTRQFKVDTRFATLGWAQSATPGLWHPYAYINGGGMNLEWLSRELGQFFKLPAQEALARLDQLAARVYPSATDPLFVPHLGGRVSPSEPGLRGSWAGLTWSHTIGHLYRAVLESVALEYCIYRDVLQCLNPELNVREIRITGGGQKSRLWNQIKADALGIPIVQIDRGEGAPAGAALVAGFGVGLFKTLEAATAKWIHRQKTVCPTRALGAHYQRRLDRYQRLLGTLSQWAERELEDTK